TMLFHIQPDGTTPIYEQIVTQVIYAVAGGALTEGALIPSVRDMAQRLLVHPNTVARAFQELERRGVLTARRGRGVGVSPEAAKACRAERLAIVQKRLRDTLHEAVEAGLEEQQLQRLVEAELKRANGAR